MKDLLRTLSLVLASVAVSLALGEVGLRLLRYGERTPVVNVDDVATSAVSHGWMKEDRRLLWRLAHCDSYCESILYADPANPKLAPRPAAGTKRIICLGDSCTFLGHERTPPYSVLLDWLFRREAAPVEVLNAGTPGYSSAQGLAWLKSELLAYQPRLVTVYFGWNDHWRAHTVSDSLYAESLALHPVRLVRLARNAREALGGRDRRGPPPFRVSPAEYAANLREIRRVVAAAGGRCLFLTAPALAVPRTRGELLANHHLGAQDDYMLLHEQYNDIVRSLAREGLEVLDLAALFRGAPPAAPLLRDDGIHLTGAGARLAAGAIHDAVVARRLLD